MTEIEPKGFQEFWALYPRKVGRLAALKEYIRARRHASQAELLDGVAEYIKMKPAYADWCHPRTWLSQGRWMDEATPAEASGTQTTRLQQAVTNLRREEDDS